MLFIVYTDPSVKFNEYIAQYIVRATSEKKARILVQQNYPKHPISILSDIVNVARVKKLRMLNVKEGLPAPHSPFFFCENKVPEPVLIDLARLLAPDCDKPIWDNSDNCIFTDLPENGKAMVFARVENRTPSIEQPDLANPIFAWRAVSDRWPNPDADPILPSTLV